MKPFPPLLNNLISDWRAEYVIGRSQRSVRQEILHRSYSHILAPSVRPGSAWDIYKITNTGGGTRGIQIAVRFLKLEKIYVVVEVK